MTILDLILSIPLWMVNGLLCVLYWLAGHIAEALALLFGLAIAFGFDPAIQSRASERPRLHHCPWKYTSRSIGARRKR